MFQSPAIRTTPRLPPNRFYLLRLSSKVRSSHLSSKFRHSAQTCKTANPARPTRIRQLIPHAQAQAQSPRTGQPPNPKPWSGRTPTHQTEKSLWTRWKQNKLKTQSPDGSSTTHAVALQPKAAPLPLSLTPNPTITWQSARRRSQPAQTTQHDTPGGRRQRLFANPFLDLSSPT